MILDYKGLVAKKEKELLERRSKISIKPGLALIWVGNDPATKTFIAVKQRMAKQLDCDFSLHHFDSQNLDQLTALIQGLNRRKDIHGIVLQLPLPNVSKTQSLVNIIAAEKDIDGLVDNSSFAAPTPTGILEILVHNKINLSAKKTVIIGNGRLVGQPLSKMFKQNGWSFEQINKEAEKETELIKSADILISCTGVASLVTPQMVHSKMIVVDGSGFDVENSVIEPLVAAVTPKKGAIGPLTVTNLFSNLITATERST